MGGGEEEEGDTKPPFPPLRRPGQLHRPGDSASSPSHSIPSWIFTTLPLSLLFHPFLSSFLRDPSSSFALHEGAPPHSHFTRVGMLLGAVVRHETEEEEEEGSHSRFFSLLLLLLLVSLLT